MKSLFALILCCILTSSCGGGEASKNLENATPFVSSWFDANDVGRKNGFQQDVAQAFFAQASSGMRGSSGVQIAVSNSFVNRTNYFLQSALTYAGQLAKDHAINRAEIKAIFQKWNEADILYIDAKVTSYGVSAGGIAQMKSSINNMYVAAILSVEGI